MPVGKLLGGLSQPVVQKRHGLAMGRPILPACSNADKN